jgi:hypothetical protein
MRFTMNGPSKTTGQLRLPLPPVPTHERWCPVFTELDRLEAAGETGEPMIEYFRQLAGGLWLLELLNERLGPRLDSLEEKWRHRPLTGFLP